jgi:hypothetical protein
MNIKSNKLKRIKNLPTEETQSMIVLSSDENSNGENEKMCLIESTFRQTKKPKRILDESSLLLEENKYQPSLNKIKSPVKINNRPQTIIEGTFILYRYVIV